MSVAGAASTTSCPCTDASVKFPSWSVPEAAMTPGQFAGDATLVSPWVVLPAAATTTTSLESAYFTASQTRLTLPAPPSEMLITSAPWSVVQWILLTMSSGPPLPLALPVVPASVGALLDVPFQIGVVAVNSAVNNGDRDAFALRNRLDLGGLQVFQVPHIVSDVVGVPSSGSASDGREHDDEAGEEQAGRAGRLAKRHLCASAPRTGPRRGG